ncbi:helix-turn-helix domain-containing protein [Roseospirillum parvum]|uniref:LuxR family transcriptional regulator n=1 Tax=Roseospirillum parvum TaxID=83401 RepID=A0A1G8FCX8_9PROT|nr:helix-turn-helix transcriptional regulator [Roseospirillum parvum]SDH79953.1 LuxR family transcriptional regulator [Roseospirillum parvum]
MHQNAAVAASPSGPVAPPPPPRLTPRERQCLSLLGQGLLNKAIAHELGIARVTVDVHIASARRRLGARTREQALVKALRLDLIEVP